LKPALNPHFSHRVASGVAAARRRSARRRAEGHAGRMVEARRRRGRPARRDPLGRGDWAARRRCRRVKRFARNARGVRQPAWPMSHIDLRRLPALINQIATAPPEPGVRNAG